MYWDGSGWAASNSSIAQANTVTEINAHAAAFATGTGSFLWQAILSSTSDTVPTLLHAAATTNERPAAPTSLTPTNGASLTIFNPTFTFAATDNDSDSLQYELQIDTVNTFTSGNLRTMTQSSSQTGWSGQDANASSEYASGTTATYVTQTPLGNATYYWRVRTIDPSGANTWSDYAATRSFTTPGSADPE